MISPSVSPTQPHLVIIKAVRKTDVDGHEQHWEIKVTADLTPAQVGNVAQGLGFLSDTTAKWMVWLLETLGVSGERL